MSTHEALENITDRGKFELLVTSILRKKNPDYAAIIHSGINAQGETIKSPVDGFCLVPGSAPPRFVFVQHTTTERNKLKAKWLSSSEGEATTEEDGDLVKAGREAEKISESFPTAMFTVVLSTNQRLDTRLATEVHKTAAGLQVACDIWEQSRISDYLDNDPDGHWLRKQYLGIEAEMLSEGLLRELCDRSAALYERFLDPLTRYEVWATRQVDEQFERAKENGRRTIVFLVGGSGSGKSVATLKALKEHIRRGGYGLWIPAEIIEESLSLEHAIDQVLHRLNPRLIADAGTIAIRLTTKEPKLLIVVDDLNRIDRPTEVLRKLRGWAKPVTAQASGAQVGKVLASNLILCPVWPQFVESSLSEGKKSRETESEELLFLGSMSPEESVAALRNAAGSLAINLTNVEVESLASRLGHDPILIGLFALLLSSGELGASADRAEEVVSHFIRDSLSQVSSNPDFRYLPIDYARALSTVASLMILKRRLYPHWTEITEWLRGHPEDLNALRELIRHGKLCRLADSDSGPFIFRHDRIRDAVLVESMGEILFKSDDARDILEEPFFAELIGRVLAKELRDESILEVVTRANPLALFEAIRHFGIPRSPHQTQIVETAKQWVSSNTSRDRLPESLQNAICWSLLETDSPAVLELTERFPSWTVVRLARLRNGCAMSGAKECDGRRGLASSYGFDLRDRVLEQAKQHHGGRLLVELKALLTSSTIDDSVRKGSLALSGFLGFTELRSEIAECWLLAKDKTQILPEAIWASCQCGGWDPGELLDPVMEYWSLLCAQNEAGDAHREPGSMEEELRFAFSHGLSDQVADYLIRQTEIHKALDSPITYILELCDMPDVIEFIVKKAVAVNRGFAGTGNFSFWTHGLVDIWDHTRGLGKRLSSDSMERLLGLWQPPTNDDFIRNQAFRLWLTATEWKDINLLRAIPSDSILFERSLARRTELGDQSVIPDLLPRIKVGATTFVGYWLQYAHNVWCDELKAAVEEHLESFKENIPRDFSGGFLNRHYGVSRLLRNIPIEDAEMLLDRFWSHLGYGGKFIQTALCIGTPRCLELASQSISRCERDAQVLKHFFMDFRFIVERLSNEESIRRVKNLRPYLDYFDGHELWELADLCERLGIPEWGKEHLVQRLSEEFRPKHYPSDEDLLKELDQFATEPHGEWGVEFWLRRFDERHDEKARIFDIAGRWLGSNANLRGLEIVAECFIRRGTREDLALLDSVEIAGDSEKIDLIKESSRFAIRRRSLD